MTYDDENDDEFFGIEDYERQIQEDQSRYADDDIDWDGFLEDGEDFDDDEEKFDLV